MHPLAKLDHRFIWHPFTQMRDWLKCEPIVIASGKGSVLRDVHGNEYLDANASIWTNLHGHRHPKINAAIQRQLRKIAHSSALGFANEPASLLAEKLVQAANPRGINDLRFTIYDLGTGSSRKSSVANPKLAKVFFSDDGSTALEVALKLSYEFTRRTRGPKTQPRFLSLDGAYHGDTVGAVSIGHIDLFHKAYSGLLFKTDKLRSPYCYRCPFNRAKPQRADARTYVKCNNECIAAAEKAFSVQKKRGKPYTAFVFEPLIQGSAGMIAQPNGWLRNIATLAREHGAQLIADEVMTGFGRTGFVEGKRGKGEKGKRSGTTAGFSPAPFPLFPVSHSLFGSHKEGIQPDFLCVAKGMTGGYLPMAATLTTQAVFDAFLGEYDEFKTFFHGHSFTANQLGSAASLASLELLHSKRNIADRSRLQADLQAGLESLWTIPQIGDIRQVGLVAGIELVRDWTTREPFEMRERAGIRVCEAMAKRGVLTRPIGNVIVLMPPYCTTRAQLNRIISALHDACIEVFR